MLLEDMLRAASRDPTRLDVVRRLVTDLRTTSEGRTILPDDLYDVWNGDRSDSQGLRTMQKIPRPGCVRNSETAQPFQRRTVDHGVPPSFQSIRQYSPVSSCGRGRPREDAGCPLHHRTNHRTLVGDDRAHRLQQRQHRPLQPAQAANWRDWRRSFALATRLTMLATQLARNDEGVPLSKSKLNFVSFTPHTSFKFGQAGGNSKSEPFYFVCLRHM